MAEALERVRTALLGQYQIERELGRGGMATVYLAQDLRHQRQVAIKVLHPELAAAIGSDRFLREIQICARLNHPHILPVLDSGAAADLSYYVMPYAAGESLRQRLDREKQLPLADALRIAREVGDALDHAHRNGVVHRDIKPENILLSDQHAVVADFGIARAVVAAGGEKLTTTGLVLGTHAYMSPEQAAGRKDIDGRSDLYSLSCVLYEMLAGQPPFTGPTAESLAFQHLSVSPRPVRALRPAVPENVDAALTKGLAKAAADRFGTAAAFAEALGAASGERTAAGVSAATTTTPRSARGAKSARVAAGVLLAGLLVVGAAFLHPHSREVLLRLIHGRVGPPSLAVLFFDNFGPSRDDDYLAAGVTEEVTTSLSRIVGLRVASRSAVERFRGRTVVPRDVGGRLRVDYMLEGSIRRSGEHLRVTAQLIRTRDGFHVWADEYEGALQDIFAVQDSIASKIASALQVALAPAERARLARRWTDNARAYAAYLTGREIYFESGSRPEPPADAQPWFEKALALDPDYAPALAGLADVLVEEWDMGRRPPDALGRAVGLARRAQELDPSLAIAWRAEARASWQTGDLLRMRDLLERAVAVDPRVPENSKSLVWVYGALDQRDRAREMIDRTLQLDPDWSNAYWEIIDRCLDWGDHSTAERIVAAGIARLPRDPLLQVARARVLESRRRYPEAVEAVRTALQVSPDFYWAHLHLASALLGARRFAEADSAYCWIADRWPTSPVVLNEVGRHEMLRRRYASAETLLRKAVTLEPRFYFAWVNLAWCYQRSDRAAETERAASKLATFWPLDGRASEDIARLDLALRRYDDAEKWARKAVALDPKRSGAHNALAWTYARRGKYDLAVGEFKTAIGLWPGSYWNYYDMARVLIESGRFPEAASAAQRSLALKPDYVDGMRALGNAYNGMGKTFQAAAQYENVLAIDSTDFGAINNLAIVFARQERYEKAIEMYRRAAGLDTTAVVPWINMADLAVRELRDLDLARSAARQSIRLGRGWRGEVIGLEILGMAEQMQGRSAAARDFYTQGAAAVEARLRANPNDRVDIGLSGTLSARLGDRARARRRAEWLARAQSKSADDLYTAASIMALAGDRDRAFEYLKRAVSAGFDDRGLMERDPDLEDLRRDPRFHPLLATVR